MKTTSNRVKLCRGAECLKNRFFICYFPVIFTYVWWVSHVYLFYAVFFTPRLANGTINYSDWITLVCYPSYGIVSMLCLVSLTRCVFTPPGVVDYGFDEMITETGHKTFCDYCELARPRRAHHCKYCGVCVRKYDHHCPWINNCVGEDNMWLFVLLSFYASWQTAITLCINLYYFYYKLYAVEVDATADRGDSAMDPFFIRHEFWVFVIDLPLTGVFFVLMTSSFLMNVIFVRSDTTKFQSVVDPLYADNFKTIKLTPCVPAMTHLFGTRRVLKWLLMPLGRHRVVPKLIYEYPKGREPNVL